MKHVAAFLISFVVLWWTWMLLVGEWNDYAWIARSGARRSRSSRWRPASASAPLAMTIGFLLLAGIEMGFAGFYHDAGGSLD